MTCQIFVQSGFIGSFDPPWSEWSQITDPDLDHPKLKECTRGLWFVALAPTSLL